MQAQTWCWAVPKELLVDVFQEGWGVVSIGVAGREERCSSIPDCLSLGMGTVLTTRSQLPLAM